MFYMPKGFIFDLDGVITDTAEYHYLAWKELTNSLDLSFYKNVNERLKGVSRIRSLEIILETNNLEDKYSLREKIKFAEIKNSIYLRLIENIKESDVLEGISAFLNKTKENHIKIALASASKNAKQVLNSLGLTHMFDYIADAAKITNSKPAPDIFLDCAENLELESLDCIGFEDADAGITAIKKAKMFAVGINVTRESDKSYFPDFSVKSTSGLKFDEIIVAYNEYYTKQKGV